MKSKRHPVLKYRSGWDSERFSSRHAYVYHIPDRKQTLLCGGLNHYVRTCIIDGCNILHQWNGKRWKKIV